MGLKKVLDLCEKRGFVKRLLPMGATENLKEALQIGPTGYLLQENLKTEWFYNMVTNRDYSVFLSKDSFIDTYEYAKEICQGKLPFGVADVVEVVDKNNVIDNGNGQTGSTTETFGFDKHFVKNKCLLRTTMFVAPSSATQFFHQWQRQRKIWWRKFSASPGRYALSDIQNNEENHTQSVDITANYSWGLNLLETLRLSTTAHDTSDNLQAKDGRRKVQACCISSEISLPSMVLNALCDAYDEPLFRGARRPLLRFHRKLAPYKISFSVTAGTSARMEDLGQLALYLCRQLRASHISSLLVPSSVKNTLESQWRQYDQLGVPYTVLLNENTLKTGIAQLRSRDTTLKESVHVSTLPTYVEQLFKNY